MKKILMPIVAIFLMTSCGEKSHQESNKSLTEKTELMQKEEKQKIEELLSEYKKSLNTSIPKSTKTAWQNTLRITEKFEC